MIIDGRAIADEILEGVKASLPEGAVPVVRAVVVSPMPATRSYLRIKTRTAQKAGMKLDIVELPDDAGVESITAAIQASGADAVIVQLPLPAHLDEESILKNIPLEKDVDVLSPAARARFANGEPAALMPPVAGAVAEILKREGVVAAGKRAVVVGDGGLVGRPVAAYLRAQGAEVTVLDKDTFEGGAAALRAAAIIVSGAGVPHLITPDMLTEGVVLIDAGTSEQGGVLAGDIDPRCAEIASVFTPVPGGVGPIAVACLFQNVVSLLQK